MNQAFRYAVRDGRKLIGAFIKTPGPQPVELLARAGLDFALLDAEHAPFGDEALDVAAAVGSALAFPLLLRPPTNEPSRIGQALDMGFSGVLAPHIDGPEAALSLAAAVRYDRGERGFSPSTRAAGYGAADPAAYRLAADAGSSIWCMIEDAAAIERIEELAAIDVIDCLFVGRADLAASMGVDRQNDPKIVDAVRAVAEAGARHGRATGIFVSSLEEAPALLALGYRVFACGSDQSWILNEGRRLKTAFEDL